MNPDLDRLQPYPFERLRALLAGVTPPAGVSAINLSIGEPKHATPQFIIDALTRAAGGLAVYPTTSGSDELRQSIAAWLMRRFELPKVDFATQVLPVAGTREALFALAQTVIDRTRASPPLVLAPNPFYQIYEGAALLAGAQPVFLATTANYAFRMQFEMLSAAQWADVQMVYVCSPGNPTGRVMTIEEWRQLFTLSDRYGFVIASDECYSEIYCDEAKPPLGGLQAAQQLGRSEFPRLVSFGSLSKRSNVPGLRSGFVAGDEAIIRQFQRYRTYHGTAIGTTVQAASVAAWNDEAHVRENRRLYARKFDFAAPRVAAVLATARPDAAFYLWAKTPIDDAEFARRLYATSHVTVLPGSYLARTRDGDNPGANFVRMALVATPDEVETAVGRIVQFARSL